MKKFIKLILIGMLLGLVGCFMFISGESKYIAQFFMILSVLVEIGSVVWFLLKKSN